MDNDVYNSVGYRLAMSQYERMIADVNNCVSAVKELLDQDDVDAAVDLLTSLEHYISPIILAKDIEIEMVAPKKPALYLVE